MDMYKIHDDAVIMAECLIDIMREDYGISATDVTPKKTEVPKSLCGISLVYGYVLGALRSYHQQLRQSLLEQGIDIGPFKSDDKA